MSSTLIQVSSTFRVVCATMANLGMHAGKKFITQNEEYMNVSIGVILSVYLPIHHVQ
jgi:hypothetical protein